ncbi:SDR family oxidoreductase [Allokutzneria sp. A3M-2-11 16]|uniref:SDR family oxidoreductase n=1 Tax=Allokutzneria sp. A3M-2-11 16 TaxID=2962043 RepID=UPI0020B7B831|nr:SDR family oxidoreductase [Allokutzneria sp. A3M-2-11 16]MCP3805266.1 SDR family oxidoreductase [Allokutzneria sp. A3M-2-11 16]
MSERVVLVTGGVRGLGRAISLAFAGHGDRVIANYFHAREEAVAFEAELAARGRLVELIRASVADRGQVDAMFDEIAARHGRLDVLVNNAASGALLPLSEVDESHWQRAFDTNLRGSLWCARRAAELMTGEHPAIVNLSSLGSSLVISDYATVGTTKAAVEALTRYLAVEYAGRGIRVNTASGGLLDNAIAGMFPDAQALADQVRAATPLGNRLGTERELAELVVFLASPAASWITGQTVVADGGLSLGSMSLSPKPSVPEPVPEPVPGAVAVVGMGVVTPGANNPDELWKVLSGEDNVFVEPECFDISSFHSTDPAAEDRSYTPRSGFITSFVPHPRLQPVVERSTLWLRHSLLTALDGVTVGDRCFAAFGATVDGSQELEEYLVYAGARKHLGDNGTLRDRYVREVNPSEYLPHRVGRNAIDGLLPDKTELVMVDTACSSSLYAVDLGMKALREGSCEVAVCGGTFAYSARNLVLFSKLSGLSRSGRVRSFDRAADGVLFSDGAGVVVLKLLDKARADGDRVLGVIEGVGLSCDGRGKAIYAPNEAGQVLALRRAYERTGTDPASVHWVIGHATGTQAGDSTELAALHRVAGSGPPALLSSNKPIVGHTGWSAGIVSLVQALSGLQRGSVPAQRYLRQPIPILDSSRFRPMTTATPLPAKRPRRVAVSSFGFGGTNAHLLLTDAPSAHEGTISADELVVVGWSAHLPGFDAAETSAWFRGERAAPDPDFGADYPLPDFAEVRLPPATLRTMDRGQIMILRAAGQLDPRVRAVCEELKDTTGVVVGHTGPTRRAVQYALRCYLGDLRRRVGEDPGFDELEREVRAAVPPSTEDAFPGIMPNLIPARLSALADWHGLNLTVDTGLSAGIDAVRCAERYLRHGDLDVAVVAGISGNSGPELASVLADQPPVAEGAFMVVLTRRATASRHGLPVLGTLRTELAAVDPSSRPQALRPLAGLGRTYLGADPILAMTAALAAERECTIGAAETWGPRIIVSPTRAAVERMERRLVPVPARVVRAELPAVPDGALVITEETEDVPNARHIRVIVDVGASRTAPDDLSALLRLRKVHDLAYLAVQRWEDGGSFAVLMVDALRDGVVHPATAPFTGLVKSLARERFAFAVLTDSKDVRPDLLATESALARELAVAVYSGGTRMEHVLFAAPVHPGPPQRLEVVVAVGGARGLTARLLADLARAHRPEIYVLSRTSPGERTDVGTRQSFIAANPQWTVQEASTEFDRLLAGARARRELDLLTGLCGPGKVRHIPCDITDSAAVMAAIDQVPPRVDLLINAAGLHNGGEVRSVPLERARAVRDTKLLGYLNLRRAFAGREPARWVNFGSLLAVLGWPGEADYCSGNDILNAAATWQRHFGGTHETTLSWALWRESGFAAQPVIRDHLLRQNALTGLSDRDGCALFAAELSSVDSAPEVTYLGPAERALISPRWCPSAGFLEHHRVRGRAVVPAAMLVDLVARPGEVVTDLEFHAPVLPGSDYRVTGDRVLSDLIAPNGALLKADRVHMTYTIHKGSSGSPVVERVPGSPITPPFYGPGGEVELSGPFASLRDVRTSDAGGSAVFAPSLGEWDFASFRIPVLLVDALVQLLLLPRTAIPVRIGRIELRTDLNDVELLSRYGNEIVLATDTSGSAVASVAGDVLAVVSGVRTRQGEPSERSEPASAGAARTR